jgi:hypothetical protein
MDFAELSYWLDATSEYRKMCVGAAEGGDHE